VLADDEPVGEVPLLRGNEAAEELTGAVSSGTTSDPVWFVVRVCVAGDGDSDANRAGPILASSGAGRAAWESVPCAGAGESGTCRLFGCFFAAAEVALKSLDSLPSFGAAGSGIAVGTGRGGDDCSLDGWLKVVFFAALARLPLNRPCSVRSSSSSPDERVRVEGWFGAPAEVAL